MIVLGGYDGGEGRRTAPPPTPRRRASGGSWPIPRTASRAHRSPSGPAPRSSRSAATRGRSTTRRRTTGATVAQPELGSVSTSVSHAVWTGDHVLVAGSFGPGEEGGSRAGLYDPRHRRVDPAPGRTGAAGGRGCRVDRRRDGVRRSRARQRHPGTAAGTPSPSTRRRRRGGSFAPPLAVRGQALVAWTGARDRGGRWARLPRPPASRATARTPRRSTRAPARGGCSPRPPRRSRATGATPTSPSTGG